MVAVTAPAVRPATPPGRIPSSRPAAPARPRLEVVEPRRRLRTGPTIALGAFLTFVVALALVTCQVILVQGQERLDRLEADLTTEAERYDRLRLQVAELEAPERIVDAATALGMAPPDTITYLTPDPG